MKVWINLSGELKINNSKKKGIIPRIELEKVVAKLTWSFRNPQSIKEMMQKPEDSIEQINKQRINYILYITCISTSMINNKTKYLFQWNSKRYMSIEKNLRKFETTNNRKKNKTRWVKQKVEKVERERFFLSIAHHTKSLLPVVESFYLLAIWLVWSLVRSSNFWIFWFSNLAIFNSILSIILFTFCFEGERG